MSFASSSDADLTAADEAVVANGVDAAGIGEAGDANVEETGGGWRLV